MSKTSLTNVYVFLISLVMIIMFYKMLREYSNQKRHMYVASSFYITELPSNRTLIRTLTVVEKSLFDPKLTCDIDGQLKPARVRRLELFIGCKWGLYFFECPTKHEPKEFFLRGDNSHKHEIQVRKPDTKKRGFVVCFSRAFYFERWQSALMTLQMYKYHKVDLMVLPVTSMIKEMFEILREYEADGLVRLKPSAVIPNIPDLNYNPNAEIDWFGQVLNFDECLSPEPEHFNLDALLGSMYVQFEAPTCGKPVVIPKRVQEGFIHHPELLTVRGEILPGYQHKWFKHNATTVIHLRHLFTEPHSSHPNTTNTFFGHDQRYHTIQKDFQQFLNRHPSARKAFNRLPKRMSYYDATHACLKKTQFQRCHSALICTPDSSIELPECIVLESDPKSTRISHNWELYTTSRHRFVFKSNCLMT